MARDELTDFPRIVGEESRRRRQPHVHRDALLDRLAARASGGIGVVDPEGPRSDQIEQRTAEDSALDIGKLTVRRMQTTVIQDITGSAIPDRIEAEIGKLHQRSADRHPALPAFEQDRLLGYGRKIRRMPERGSYTLAVERLRDGVGVGVAELGQDQNVGIFFHGAHIDCRIAIDHDGLWLSGTLYN